MKKYELYYNYCFGGEWTWAEESSGIDQDVGELERLFANSNIQIEIFHTDGYAKITCSYADAEKAEAVMKKWRESPRKFVNLTPHTINICVVGVTEMNIEPSGTIARCSETSAQIGTRLGIPIIRKSFGSVEGLPDPVEGTIYIASALVCQAAKRQDVMSPGDPIRDESGRIIGCKSLCSYV